MLVLLNLNSSIFNLKLEKRRQEEAVNSVQTVTLEDQNGESFEASYTTYKDYNTSKYNEFKNSAKRIYLCQLCPFNSHIFGIFKEHLLKHKFKKDSFECKHCPFYESTKTKIVHHENLHLSKAIHDFNDGLSTRNVKSS